jgi:AcrR family transcriptional regulator
MSDWFCAEDFISGCKHDQTMTAAFQNESRAPGSEGLERAPKSSWTQSRRAVPPFITNIRQEENLHPFQAHTGEPRGERQVIDFLTIGNLYANERSLYFIAGHNFMRRANVQLAADRRSEILAAAQTCFARSGFHQTSMQEICAEAGMSPGNLYRYFRSKEEIIAGIAERDRAETAQNFAAVSAENFFDGLAALAQQHLVERSLEEVALCAEIMAESRRNPAVARIYQDIEADVRARFIELLKNAAERGQIRRDIDLNGTVTVLFALADGLSWRRAVEPSFNAEAVMPIVLRMIEQLLVPSANDNGTGGQS